MERADYEGRIARGYDASRAVPESALEAWRAVLSTYLPPETSGPVLDLGCGTGLWTGTLHRWFSVDVVGMEPAAAMRAQAPAKGISGHTFFSGGRAEAIPLRNASCSCAWLSTVVHHVEDLEACSRELRRVLVDGGRVMIRSGFPGRSDDLTMFRYWPDAKRFLEALISLEQVERAFSTAGFRREELRSVPQTTAESLRDYAQRAALRADSVLARLDDEEFDRGMAALQADVEAETDPTPIIDSIDLLVLA